MQRGRREMLRERKMKAGGALISVSHHPFVIKLFLRVPATDRHPFLAHKHDIKPPNSCCLNLCNSGLKKQENMTCSLLEHLSLFTISF